MGVIIGVLNIQLAFAAPPMWWTNRQVRSLDESSNPVPAADFAPANLGQLKNIARKAYDELKESLQPDVWSTPEGQAIVTLIAGWYEDPNLQIPKPDKDFAMINQGQLKYVARRFYDLLGNQGIDVSSLVGEGMGDWWYPWTETTSDDADHAVATLGQLKHVFSFGLDADQDGLSDWWEIRLVDARSDDAITSVDQILPNDDFDGDGLTNLQEYKARTDATLYSQDVTLDGLQFWAKGESGVELDANGKVTHWSDQSGKGHHVDALAAAGRQPSLGFHALNNFGVIGFDGIDDLLKPASGLTTANNFTAFFVARAQTTHEIDVFSNTGTAGVSGQRYLLFPPQGGAYAGAGLSVGTNGITVYEHGDNYMPARAVYSGNGMTGNLFKVIELAYLNREPTILLNGQVVVTGWPSPRTLVMIGSELGGSTAAAGANNFFQGDVGEVLIYDRTLTDLERKMILNHLAYRWVDTDDDTLPDGWEIANQFSPQNPTSADPDGVIFDRDFDSDGDLISNRREYELGSDPRDVDSGFNRVLAAWWKFDDGRGTLLTDSSGNNYHAVLLNSGDWIRGMDKSDALQLNGVNQSASVSAAMDDKLDFGVQQSFSIAFWFKTTGAGVYRLVSKGDSNASNGFFAGIGQTTPGAVTLGVGAGGVQAGSLLIGTTTAFNDGKWHQAVTFFNRKDKKAGIYVDGQACAIQKAAGTGTGGTVANNEFNFSSLTSLNPISTQPLYLGSANGDAEFFQGGLDDVKVFATALLADEATRFYTDIDTDYDHMPNWWELEYGFDPADPADANGDPDFDNIVNLGEFLAGSDPRSPTAGVDYQIYVAPSVPLGQAKTGTFENPFDSLKDAKDAAVIKSHLLDAKSVTIYMRSGEYQMLPPANSPAEPAVNFTGTEFGLSHAPVAVKPYGTEQPVLHGAVTFIPTGIATPDVGFWTQENNVTVYNGGVDYDFVANASNPTKTVSLWKFVFTGAKKAELAARINGMRAAELNANKFSLTELYIGNDRKIRSRHPNKRAFNTDTSPFDGDSIGEQQHKVIVDAKWVGSGAFYRELIADGATELTFTRQWQEPRALITAASVVFSPEERVSLNMAGLANPLIYDPQTGGSHREFPYEADGFGMAEIKGKITYSDRRDYWDKGHFENNLHFVDFPGEWFFKVGANPETDEMALYYYLQPGETPESYSGRTFYLPFTYTLIGLNWVLPPEASPTSTLSGISLEGLEMKYTSWKYENGRGNSDFHSFVQACYGLSGVVDGNFLDNISIKNCNIHDFGLNGITLGGNRRAFFGIKSNDNYDAHARSEVKNLIIQSNTIKNGGGGAIRIDHYPRLPSRGGDWNDKQLGNLGFYDNSQIIENTVNKTGRVFGSSVGIVVGKGFNTKVNANIVSELPYTGIHVNAGCWRSQEERLEIVGNTVFKTMQRLLDGGGIYTFGGRKILIKGNRVHQNGTVRTPGDAVSLPPPPFFRYNQAIVAWTDIYLDWYSYKFTVSGNKGNFVNGEGEFVNYLPKIKCRSASHNIQLDATLLLVEPIPIPDSQITSQCESCCVP
jgi:hypothetical protein